MALIGLEEGLPGPDFPRMLENGFTGTAAPKE
jgi:hypothetical protein